MSFLQSLLLDVSTIPAADCLYYIIILSLHGKVGKITHLIVNLKNRRAFHATFKICCCKHCTYQSINYLSSPIAWHCFIYIAFIYILCIFIRFISCQHGRYIIIIITTFILAYIALCLSKVMALDSLILEVCIYNAFRNNSVTYFTTLTKK